MFLPEVKQNVIISNELIYVSRLTSCSTTQDLVS